MHTHCACGDLGCAHGRHARIVGAAQTLSLPTRDLRITPATSARLCSGLTRPATTGDRLCNSCATCHDSPTAGAHPDNGGCDGLCDRTREVAQPAKVTLNYPVRPGGVFWSFFRFSARYVKSAIRRGVADPPFWGSFLDPKKGSFLPPGVRKKRRTP